MLDRPQQSTPTSTGMPGEFGFDQKDTSVTCSEAAGVVKIPVTRRNGASGDAEVTWSTEDVTALEGTHYVKSQGTLSFQPGEMVHEIEVSTIVKQAYKQAVCPAIVRLHLVQVDPFDLLLMPRAPSCDSLAAVPLSAGTPHR